MPSKQKTSATWVKISNTCAVGYGYVRVIYTPIRSVTRSAPLVGSLSRGVRGSRQR